MNDLVKFAASAVVAGDVRAEPVASEADLITVVLDGVRYTVMLSERSDAEEASQAVTSSEMQAEIGALAADAEMEAAVGRILSSINFWLCPENSQVWNSLVRECWINKESCFR